MPGAPAKNLSLFRHAAPAVCSALRPGCEDVEPKDQRTVLGHPVPSGENVALQSLAFLLAETPNGVCERRAPNVLPQAVARVLLGAVNPSGKLPVRIPASSDPTLTLYPFGFGIGY
jgi:hypothetical protein